jgi:DNA-binding transcriptional LysR family regulator
VTAATTKVPNHSPSPLGITLGERRLGYFHAAVRAGSIRAAADDLDVEPSVISRQIQLLEREVGVVLLERRGRGVSPTDAGELVLEHYKACSASQESLVARLGELQGIQKGKILISAGEGFARGLIDVAMNSFCREYPSIAVSLELTSVVEVLRSVTEDRAHIGVAYGLPGDHDLKVVAEKSHPVRVIARPDHPLLAIARPLRISDLVPYSIGLMPPQYGLGQLARLAEFTESTRLAAALVTNSISALKHYASSGVGVTLLPEMAVQEEINSGSLVALRTSSTALESAKAQLLLRDGRVHSPGVQELVRRLSQMDSLS